MADMLEGAACRTTGDREQPPERPGCMPANQPRIVLARCALERRHGGGVAGVAEHHRRVAREPDASGAAHGAGAVAPRKAGVVEIDRLGEEGRQRVAAGAGRIAVPRAGYLAEVTAEDPAAEEWPQGRVDRAAMLDRQVRDAAARLEPVARLDRPGRTGGDA